MKSGMLLVLTTISCVTSVSRAETPPTFSKDVAPILFDNCVSCHRANEVAPFRLTSYEDARKRAKTIAKVTGDRFMPPWKAEPGHGDFLNVRRLSDEQIKTLKAWAEAGAPEGDAGKTPALPKFYDGWQLGEPDLVVTMPETYTLRAEGPDVYRVFVLPLNLTEDKFVSAIEFRPGNRKVVHHALFFLDNTGAARKLDAADPGPGYSIMGGVGFAPAGGLGGWAPGYQPTFLPDGIARKIRANCDLVLQLHMHPSGRPEKERATLGLHFSKKKPEKIIATIPSMIRAINMAPGDADYKLHRETVSPLPGELIGITPHAHLLCKEIKADATLPDGKQIPLIWIKDWDFNWQGEYRYTKPIHIPAGTKFTMDFRYDNSANNPAQPSTPPKRVRWGEQTTDEMAIIFYQVLVDPDFDYANLAHARSCARSATKTRSPIPPWADSPSESLNASTRTRTASWTRKNVARR
jgi:hypothetical protein